MGMTTRREFLASVVGTAGHFAVESAWAKDATTPYDLVAVTDHARILAAANRYLSEQPITVTSSHSERSKGGLHDYFSEGDYWWPDEKNPNGPYVRRDGFTNPANFDDHRKAMVRLSLIVPALAAGVETDRRKKICRSRGPSSPRMVRRSGYEDEREPRVRAGDLQFE
jgi:hypothetical protein